MHAIIENFLDPAMLRAYGPDVLEGMWVTIQLSVLVVLSGLGAGLVLAAIRAFQIRVVNWVIVGCVDICRALPPLVLIIVCYFGLPYLSIKLSGFVVAWLVLSGILVAFAEEVFWAGLTSVAKAQWEGARSTGLTFAQTLRFVVLPQAVRIVVPPLTSRVVAIVKNTALASTVAVPEMLARASEALAQGANTTPLTMAAVGYLVLLLPLVRVARWLETRYAWNVR